MLTDVQIKNESRIISQYNKVAKPLINYFERIGTNIPVNCLNEIRALNDHLARCYRKDITGNAIDLELSKAEGHLERLVLDSFKQLIIFLRDDIESLKRKYYSDKWREYESGSFWIQYTDLERDALMSEIEAKKRETIDKDESLKMYQKAFINLYRIKELILGLDLKDSFRYKWFGFVKNNLFWLIETIILTAIATFLAYMVTCMMH